jgi:hypothetical protein
LPDQGARVWTRTKICAQSREYLLKAAREILLNVGPATPADIAVQPDQKNPSLRAIPGAELLLDIIVVKGESGKTREHRRPGPVHRVSRICNNVK